MDISITIVYVLKNSSGQVPTCPITYSSTAAICRKIHVPDKCKITIGYKITHLGRGRVVPFTLQSVDVQIRSGKGFLGIDLKLEIYPGFER